MRRAMVAIVVASVVAAVVGTMASAADYRTLAGVRATARAPECPKWGGSPFRIDAELVNGAMNGSGEFFDKISCANKRAADKKLCWSGEVAFLVVGNYLGANSASGREFCGMEAMESDAKNCDPGWHPEFHNPPGDPKCYPN